jgi:hypothetical protein
MADRLKLISLSANGQSDELEKLIASDSTLVSENDEVPFVKVIFTNDTFSVHLSWNIQNDLC